MLDVLSVGNANVDLLINSDSLNGDLIPVVMPGGSACNFAVGCARLGLNSGFLGFTGRDYFGRLISDDLKRERVKSFIRVVQGQTGFVIVFTKGRFKKYVKYVGVNECLSGLELRSFLGKARHVHLATPPLTLLLGLVLRKGASVSIDPGSTLCKCGMDVLGPCLAGVDFFFPNEDEALSITGRRDFRGAAKDLLDAGVKVVVVKLSRRGVYVLSRSESFIEKSIDFPVIDTTGAGDAFASAFIACWLRGGSLLESARWGIISSNVCVTKLGAQNSAALNELSEIYRKYYSIL